MEIQYKSCIIPSVGVYSCCVHNCLLGKLAIITVSDT